MSWFVVDVEADGPCPGLYSMVSFGVVRLDRDLKTTFYGKTAPLADAVMEYDRESLAISGTTREMHKSYPGAGYVMVEFDRWIADVNVGSDRPIFVSDNPAFDWQWINYYFCRFVGKNPFGHSARRIGDLYAGLKGDTQAGWKQLRKTRATHNPVDDAMGNAEALLAMADMGLRIGALK